MTVGTIDLDRGRDFAVDMPIAVRVLCEVAIHALETQLHVDRRQVHRFLELVRIVVSHRLAGLVEQRTVTIALEYRAEIPPVAVVIGELRVLELGI